MFNEGSWVEDIELILFGLGYVLEHVSPLPKGFFSFEMIGS